MARKTARQVQLSQLSKPARVIGGKVEREYNSLRSIVETINDRYFRFMYFLDLAQPGNAERFLKAIEKGNSGICGYYCEKTLEDYKAGRIRKESVLNKKWIVNENTPPEKREELLAKEESRIHRACLFKYKEAVKQFKERGYYWNGDGLSLYEKRYIEPRQIREILYLSEDGLEVDTLKFIEYYKSFIAAEESETRQQHQKIADDINHFFNGVEVTEKELFRYFKIEDGILKINPSSVNIESYARLGQRKFIVTKD